MEVADQTEEIQSVWVPCSKNVFAIRKVVAFNNDDENVTVELISGDKENEAEQNSKNVLTLPLSKTLTCDPTHFLDLENLVDLNNLHEAALLDMLRRRFQNGKPLTFSGQILISINPYENIEEAYSMPSAGSAVPTGPDATPSLLTVAARALEELQAFPEGYQSIIINGESGAGKTEASKIIIKYLSETNIHDQSHTAAFNAVKEYLLRTNMLLEQFGNSKTIRNNNSSRFGKFIRLGYSAEQNLVQSHISCFLLESGRVIHHSPLERSFHIFYAICQGLSDEERAAVGGLEDWSHYQYLNGQSSTPEEESGKSWESVKSLLLLIGVGESEIKEMVMIIKGILELGNIQVDEIALGASVNPEEDASFLASTTSTKNLLVASIDPKQRALCTAAEALGIDPDSLNEALMKRKVTIKTAEVQIEEVERSKGQSEDAINSLAKALYVRLFNWVVKQVNNALVEKVETAGTSAVCGYINILDIYGFEILEKNSLEQLCINFANERLQRQFNGKVFDSEQLRYAEEGVIWQPDRFKYIDNEACINLIGSRKLSIFSLIDEQSTMLHHGQSVARAGGTNVHESVESQLLAKLNRNFGGKASNPHFKQPKIKSPSFIIKHFAGEVSYDVHLLPKKNFDILPSEIVSAISKANVSGTMKKLFHLDLAMVLEEELDIKNYNERHSFKVNSVVPKVNWNRVDDFASESKSSLQESISIDENLSVGGSSESESKIPNFVSSDSSLKREKTTCQKFRSQLDYLVNVLDDSTPHYIRCIVPNRKFAPRTFDAKLVLNQLKCIGIMETVRIRQVGYPVRIKYKEFFKRYEVLDKANCRKALAEGESAYHDAAKRILEPRLKPGSWALGKNYVFLKENKTEKLEKCRRSLEDSSAVRLQAFVRKTHERRSFLNKRSKAVEIQAFVRKTLAKREFDRKRVAARKIQNLVRKVQAEQKRIELLRNESAVEIQKIFRGMSSRKKTAKRREAAEKISKSIASLFRNKRLAKRLCALEAAARSGDFKKLNRLCTEASKKGYLNEVKGVRIGSRLQSLLSHCVSSGSVELVEAALDKKSSIYALNGDLDKELVDHVDVTGDTLLHEAARLKDHEKAMAMSIFLINAHAVCDFSTAAESGEKMVTLKAMEGVVFKRRVGQFKKRHMELHPREKLLTYIHGGLFNSDGKRFTILRSTDEEVVLRTSEKFINTFEITSERLKIEKKPQGVVYFKFGSHADMHDWITEIRKLEFVSFESVARFSSEISLTNWKLLVDMCTRLNKKKESPVHIAVGMGHILLSTYLLPLLSYGDDSRLSSLLKSPNAHGMDMLKLSKKSGFEEMVSIVKSIQHSLKPSSKSWKQQSQMEEIFMHTRGTYLSLVFSELSIVGKFEVDKIAVKVSVVDSAMWGSKAEAALEDEDNDSEAKVPPIELVELVMKPCKIPVLASSSEDGKMILSLGSLWHCGIPLEQMGSEGLSVIFEVEYGKKMTIGVCPIEAGNVGKGKLSPGLHTLFLVPSSPLAKPGIIKRALRNIGIGKPGKPLSLEKAGECHAGLSVRSHVIDNKQPMLSFRAHYSHN